MVFEIVSDGDAAAALGGGGRYDGLVQALGGSESVPAMGFAYNVKCGAGCAGSEWSATK